MQREMLYFVSGGESFSRKFGITVSVLELVIAILYGLTADYAVYSAGAAANTAVLQHYGYVTIRP